MSRRVGISQVYMSRLRHNKQDLRPDMDDVPFLFMSRNTRKDETLVHGVPEPYRDPWDGGDLDGLRTETLPEMIVDSEHRGRGLDREREVRVVFLECGWEKVKDPPTLPTPPCAPGTDDHQRER